MNRLIQNLHERKRTSLDPPSQHPTIYIKQTTYPNKRHVRHTKHCLAVLHRLRHGDGEVLVRRKIIFMVDWLERSVVQDLAHDVLGRMAGPGGAGLQADGDADFLGSCEGVLSVSVSGSIIRYLWQGGGLGEEGGKAYRSLHLHGKLMASFDGVAGLGQSDPGVLRKGAGS